MKSRSMLLSALRDVRGAVPDSKPIVVAGASELVPLLAKDLRTGGDPSAVRENAPPGSAAVYVWLGKPDEAALRAASRTGVPLVGVTDGESLPYVLDTHLVAVRPGEGLPVDEIARAIAVALRDRGTSLAARLPVVREAVLDELVRRYSRQNALIAAAVFVPGVDMPVLTLNEIRLVTRIALAHGQQIDGSRVPELLGVVGAGFGFRAVARQLLDFVPFAGWATKGAVAYGGTKAIGEAARLRFAGPSDGGPRVRTVDADRQP